MQLLRIRNIIDDPYQQVRQAVVEQISKDRAAAGLASVELDLFSSAIADRHCQEMAARSYLSHWNLRGLLPHQRYHLAGGRDHVQENLSRLTMISSQPHPLPTSPDDLLPYLLDAHQRLLNEQPPLDGHRRNILDPAHTHVGIGLGVVGQQLTVGQLFVNRYVQLAPFPQELPKGSIRVEGQVLQEGYGPYYCALFYEGEPLPRRPDDLNETYAYSDTEGDLSGTTPPWKMRFSKSNGRFRFSVSVQARGSGYYHLLLWVRDRVPLIPYNLSRAGSYQVDTKQAIPCAGWIFRG